MPKHFLGMGSPIYRALTHYWLPAGFLLFLVGLFLAPGTHNFKVIMNFTLLLPALISCVFIQRWWSRAPVRLLLPVTAYVGYMAANAFAQNGAEGDDYLQWGGYVLLFLIGVGLNLDVRRRTLAQLLWVGAIVASGAALYAIVRDLASGALMQPGYRLIGYGPLYNPLRTGHLFGVFFIIAAWCFFARPLHVAQRWSGVLCSVLLLIAILLTGSRSPLFALFLVAVLALGGLSHREHRWKCIGALIAIVGLTFVMFGASLLARGMSLRPQLWQQVLQLCADNPWFGVGLGNPIVLATDGVHFSDTHNVFLAALYYGGGVGLLLFLLTFGTAFWFAWRRRDRSPLFTLAALLQLFGIATLQFDGGSLIGRPTEFWHLYWLPLALALFASRHGESGRARP